MRIIDWSSDVCSSDLEEAYQGRTRALLSRRRPARDVDLAGHAIGRRRGQVSCWNEPVSGDLSVGNARRTAEAIVRNVRRTARLSDRKSVVKEKSVSVRVALGGNSYIKNKKKKK